MVKAPRARSLVVILAVAMPLTLSACRVGGLSFREDKRVQILMPEDNSTVTLPFELRWRVNDFQATGLDGSATNERGFFVVFLDSSPVPPGESLAYVARDDEFCKRKPGCPDERYLADRHIYETRQTSLRITTLVDNRPPDRPTAADNHQITIALFNGRGKRIGEAAFSVDFKVDREAQT